MKGKLSLVATSLEDVEEPISSNAPNCDKWNGKNQTFNKQQPRSSTIELLIRKHTIKIEK